MLSRVLLAPKLRLASFGVAGTMFASAVFPSALAYAAAANTPASTGVPAQDIASALEHVRSKLDIAALTTATGDSHAALKSAVGGATLTAPNDARNGVSLNAPNSGPAVNVQLPNASQDGNAQQIGSGVVAYAGTNGSANAVQATQDGVRLLTVIDNPSAPTAYDYKITVPDGGKIELTTNGGAVVLDKHGKLIADIATPWATDATGKAITTYFTTDGQTLTQHIEHNVPGVVYPVTADPWWQWHWWGYTVYLNKWETQVASWGVVGVIGYFGWTGIGGAAAAVIAAGAQYAIDHGYCLAVNMPFWGWPFIVNPWMYRC